jgi:predicted enzyme related to lactoylglutathione lyase
LLIDWEQAGPDRRFEIRVPDVQKASSFYRNVLGAIETFRRGSSNGELVRIGLAAGNVGFVISSEEKTGVESAVLSILAADLGVPYVAVILPVDDPDQVASDALKSEAKLVEAEASGEIVIISDPFGSHWALVRRKSTEEPAALSGRRTYSDTALH